MPVNEIQNNSGKLTLSKNRGSDFLVRGFAKRFSEAKILEQNEKLLFVEIETFYDGG